MRKSDLSREVHRRLLAEYGHLERRGGDPTDVLIRTVLSQNTTDKNSHRAHARLKERYPTVEDLASADLAGIEDAIRVGGLYTRKARIIRDIARRRLSDPVRLDRMDNSEARRYLKSLEGVGSKTASCVLLFALRRDVMPVDTHVYRTTRRLGLLASEVPFNRADEELEKFIPEKIRYDLHVDLIRHGRRVCRPTRPACPQCILLDICRFGRNRTSVQA